MMIPFQTLAIVSIKTDFGFIVKRSSIISLSTRALGVFSEVSKIIVNISGYIDKRHAGHSSKIV